MISANFAEVKKSLEKYKAEVDRKLTYMVRMFAYRVTETAIGNTPLGDAEKYAGLYALREKSLGLDPRAGFAQGSWQVSSSNNFELQETYSGDTALGLVKTSLAGYKLGNNLYIGNKGYYIQRLEAGSSKQAPLGISKPTTDHIFSVLQTDLVRLFREG